MRIGFYSESPADQAALAVFAEGVLGEPPEPINMDLQARGVTNVLQALDGVFRGVYYNSDAEGFVVVVDSDDAELHEDSHDNPESASGRCRFCQLRTIITRARSQMRRIPGRAELRVAIGVAVPTVEAWYLAGKNHQVGEASWRVARNEDRTIFTRPKLKALVYGTERPSLELMTKRAVDEARRMVENIAVLEDAFPIGFGLMAREIRSWRRPDCASAGITDQS